MVDVNIKVDSERLDLQKYTLPPPDPTEVLMPDLDDVVDTADAPSSSSASDSAAARHDVNPAYVEQLKQMGFSENRAIRALLETGNISPDVAMEWLFTKMDDASLDDPLPPPKPNNTGASGGAHGKKKKKEGAGGVSVDEGLVGVILDMGFTRDQAVLALKNERNNVERAIEWLFNNPDASLLPIDDHDNGDGAGDGNDSGHVDGGEAGEPGQECSQYELVAIIAHKGRHVNAGHYVCYIKYLHDPPTPETVQHDHSTGTGGGDGSIRMGDWVLFNDEKVVKFAKGVEQGDRDVGSGYLYFWKVRER